MTNYAPRLASALALSLVMAAGCSSSHGREDGGGGVACGPVTCGAGLVCCNASCGICTEPGGECSAIACVDAGPPACGVGCGLGEACCEGCPGDAPFCASGGACPDLDCPPPPPGCEGCGVGATCCEGCPGEGSFCSAAGASCPLLDCRPTGCELILCEPGTRCCPGCPGGGGASCQPPDASCPDVTCMEPIPCSDLWQCSDDQYCARETCGGEGVCLPRPMGCARDCPGVCGCDGETYCNECNAQQAGTTVAHAGSCVPSSCEGRDYCDCTGDCAPLIDLTPGCVCPCNDPFNCTGEICACACGGAEYLGCALFGQCAETEVHCDAGCAGALDAAGCPTCLCSIPPG